MMKRNVLSRMWNDAISYREKIHESTFCILLSSLNNFKVQLGAWLLLIMSSLCHHNHNHDTLKIDAKHLYQDYYIKKIISRLL